MMKTYSKLLRYSILFTLMLGIATAANAQVPVISTVTPQSGPIGTKVVITGNNFGATPALNVVRFGPVFATVATATATSLTVIVPIGASYAPITITTNLLTASSLLPFTVTKAITQNLSSTSFTPHADFGVLTSPQRFSLADYDHNGITDITLVTNATGFNNFSIFRSKADCKNLSFDTEQLIYSGSHQTKGGMANADFDGDGKTDIAVSETADNFVTVHQNISAIAGSISIQNQQTLGSTTLPTRDLKIADMDGDGRADIVVALFSSLGPTSGVAIYRNTSTAINVLSFTAPQVVSFLANPTGLELADVDGDGRPDILVSDGITGVHIRRNKSIVGTLDNTSFDPEVTFTTATTPADLRMGDIDGDGKADLAVACGSAISLLRNTATAGIITAASFAAHVDVTGVSPGSIDLGDLNGDGKTDLAVGNGSNVSVYQNQATSGSITSGSLGAKLDFSIGTASIGEIRLTDMNEDGYMDIVAAQSGSFFSVFLFNPPVQIPPAITSFSPASGVPGSTVTITGTNFGVSVAANNVFFGATKATLVSATATQIVATVPSYATYAPVTVVNLADHLSFISSKYFDPLFNNNKDFGGRIIPAAMSNRTDVNIGTSNASSVNFGDIDGDGFSDLLISGTSNDSLIIFRNKGTKTLKASAFEKTGIGFNTDGNGTVVAKDVDGDGKLDVVMMVRGVGDQDEVLIYHNESTPGTLSAASFGPVFEVHLPFLSINNTQFVMPDLDGDGKPELVCENSGKISIFKNNSIVGSFCFAPSFDIASAGGQDISAGDIDGDGKLDLAVAGGYYGTPGFKLIRNISTTGILAFATPVTFATADGNIDDVEIADLDNDGKPDLSWISPDAAGTGLHVMKNIAVSGIIDATSFAAEYDYPWPGANYNPYGHHRVADINGDGKPEVIACQTLMGIFENNSQTGVIDANTFKTGVTFNIEASYGAQYPAVGDLDGDGKPEVVITEGSYTANKIAIYRNETYPAPRIDLLKNSSGTTQSGLLSSQISTQGDFQFTNNDSPTIRFGSVSGTVTGATNTIVNTNVPAGATNDRVSVTLHGLTGSSPLPFNQTFITTGVLDATTFAVKVDFPLISGPTSALTTGDLDGDGKPDLVIGESGSISVVRNTLTAPATDINTASFTNLPQFGSGIGSDAIAVTDIDGDGALDLLANSNGFRNNSGTQAQPITFETSVQVAGGAFANVGRPKTDVDFNHDGKNEQVVTNTNTIFVSENRSIKGSFSTGTTFATFAPAITFAVIGNPGEASAADFDGDGFDDIVFVNTTNGQLTTMRNAGLNTQITTASFGAQQSIATGAAPFFIFISDFNVDGKMDVAVAYNSIATISVFQNTSSIGTISFSKQDFVSLPNAVNLNAADLDGDGKPEIVTVHSSGAVYNFSILKNTSSGAISFAPKLDYTLASQPGGLALADVNLDGKKDIIITRAPSTLSVFQNQLISSGVITVDTQPTDASVCAGVAAVLSVAASGTTNITYQWQFSATATGTFADVSDGAIYSGAASAKLTINTTGNAGAGFYQVNIKGDNATPVLSSRVQVVVNPVPAAPTGSGGSSCNGGTVTLTATGASDGNYKWYTTSTGASVITGQVNGAFTTPALTATTTYYVSATNSTCESARTPVIATILATACSGNAPVIKSESLTTVPGGTIVLDLVPLITATGALDVNSIRVIVPPGSGATAVITKGVLTIDYNGKAFTGNESITIEACDQSGMCAQQTFAINVADGIIVYNGVSANGDGKNDFFNILNIELLPDTKNNQVKIYNRWGDEVFSVSDYDNDTRVFNGTSNAGNKLPAGTYFYKVEMPDAKKTITGYLSLKY